MMKPFAPIPVHRLGRRKFALGLLFCSAAGIAAVRQPSVAIDYLGDGKLEDLVPKVVDRWEFVTNSGLIVPPEDQLSDALYSELLTRVYADGQGSPIMLLVAQSSQQTGVLQIHRPEVCYPAGGYQLSPIAPHPVQTAYGTVPAMSLAATADGRTEHILYWTRVGNMLPTTWAEQRWAVAKANLQGFVPDAVLVRVSTVSNDRSAALAAMEKFVRALVGALPEAKRRVLIV